MQAESDIKPEKFVIDVRGERAIISFNDNIEEHINEETGENKFYYDNYTLEITNREGLYEEIENNYNKYLKLAKSQNSENT